MKPSLAELRVFVTVAETGHITRAAEQLDLSQSAASAAIAKLERLLGTRLFDRHTRSCWLTPAGVALLPNAHRMVLDWDRLLASAQDFATLARGRITVAAPTAQSALLLPPLIAEFTSLHPGVRVILRDVSEDQIHDLIRTGAADLGIATRTEARSDLVATPFYSDQYVAAMHPNHPLAQRRTLDWQHVCAHPVIGPLPDNPVRAFVDERLAREGMRLDYRYEVSLPWTMVGLAREGLGLAVVTVALRPLTQWRQLVVRPIGRPVISRTLSLLRPPGQSQSPLVAAFMDLLSGKRLAHPER